MSCEYCVAAVERQVGAIEGVTVVAADLATGDVAVASTQPLTHEEMTAAVANAGFKLAS